MDGSQWVVVWDTCALMKDSWVGYQVTPPPPNMAVHNSFQQSLVNQGVLALALVIALALLHCQGFETR